MFFGKLGVRTKWMIPETWLLWQLDVTPYISESPLLFCVSLFITKTLTFPYQLIDPWQADCTLAQIPLLSSTHLNVVKLTLVYCTFYIAILVKYAKTLPLYSYTFQLLQLGNATFAEISKNNVYTFLSNAFFNFLASVLLNVLINCASNLA